jgi:hypothetical protein
MLGFLLVWVLGGVTSDSALAAGGSLAERFRRPSEAGKMTVYWIWLGPAVDQQTVERDLQNMQQAGIGGGVLLPVYPIALDNPERGIRNLAYLSPEFLQVLRYAARRSRELGLSFDLTLGTGWPYGGPSVSPEEAAHMLILRETPISPQTTRLSLPPLRAGEAIVALFLRTSQGLQELKTTPSAGG